MAYGLSACCLRLLLLAGFAAPVPGFLTEGSRCWVAVSASAGTCSKDRDCLEALTAIWDNRPRPSHCGFDDSHEIVCCPDDENGHLGPPYTSPSVAACSDYEIDYILKQIKPIIIEGEEVKPLEFPHMAALGYKISGTQGISWKCGGTLISNQFVLTAAHCCPVRSWKRLLRVRLGAIDLSSPGAASDLYGVSEIIVHPGYNRSRHQSDIALLKLDRRVEFSLSVFPACLDTQHADPPSFTAAGWGSIKTHGMEHSSTLMKTTLYPFPVSECIEFFRKKFPNDSSSVICAGDPEGKSDTCAGDSGGPIVVGEAPPFTVVGITSAGPRPCAGKNPSMYTRVFYYIDWIEGHVWPSHD